MNKTVCREFYVNKIERENPDIIAIDSETAPKITYLFDRSGKIGIVNSQNNKILLSRKQAEGIAKELLPVLGWGKELCEEKMKGK